MNDNNEEKKQNNTPAENGGTGNDFDETEFGDTNVHAAKPDQEKTEKVPAGDDKSSGKQKIEAFSKKAAETASKLADKSYEKIKDFDPRTTVRLLDSFIGWSRNIFPPEKFEALSEWFTKHGHAGIVVAQVLSIIFGLFSAIALGRVMLILYGIGIALLLAILQYSAEKFINAGKALIDASPSRIGSMAFLDCTFLILEVSGLLLFLAFAKEGLVSALVGLGVWALCDAVAYVALYPKMVNIEIAEDTRAGEEAIGIMSFFAKAVLKIVPIAFGIGAIIGTLALLLGVVSLVFGHGVHAGNRAVALLVFCTCLPFASYVLFMIYHLSIDVLRAILLVPHKLDSLKKSDDGNNN